MSSPLRVVLFLASVLGVAAVVFFWSRSAPEPEATADEPSYSEYLELRAAPEPSAAAVPTVETPRPPSATTASSAAISPTDAVMAAEMHALEDSAPERALALAQRGQALWPEGPRAPEFAAAEVKCLYRLGRPSDGRGAAEAMVNKYPTSPWALEVEKQTGAHPHVDH
jgi:hypothetical protein